MLPTELETLVETIAVNEKDGDDDNDCVLTNDNEKRAVPVTELKDASDGESAAVGEALSHCDVEPVKLKEFVFVSDTDVELVPERDEEIVGADEMVVSNEPVPANAVED